MPEVTGRCPMCDGELVVTHLRCQQCGTGLEGVFTLNKFDRLSREQLRFADVFVKNRGVIRDVERELGISYPTVRSRLDEVIRALGYDAPAGGAENPGPGTGASAAYSSTAATSWAAGGAGGTSATAVAGAPPAPPAAESGGVSSERRREILDRLATGALSAEQAIQLLRGDAPESGPVQPGATARDSSERDVAGDASDTDGTGTGGTHDA